MKASIGNSLIAKIKPAMKEFDIWDTKLTGFILRVYPNGQMVYRCEYARGKRATIGKANTLTPAQARDRAKEILANFVKGIDHNQLKKKNKQFNLRDYITNEYKPWLLVNSKTGKKLINNNIIPFVKEWGEKALMDITPLLLEKWKIKRIENGIKHATINKNINMLKAALSKAVEWEFITANPLSKLKPTRIDTIAKTRYLTKDEEIALRKALDQREDRLKLARSKANQWRTERGYSKKFDLHLLRMFRGFNDPPDTGTACTNGISERTSSKILMLKRNHLLPCVLKFSFMAHLLL